jgi:DNA replication protein DnaC
LQGEYLDKRENVFSIGNPGTGKKHLVCALAFSACVQGRNVRFHTATDLVTQLVECREEKRRQRLLNQLQRFHLLVIDELGCAPFSKAGAELLFEVIGRAYEHQSLMLTTNFALEEWTKIFGSGRLTGALLDRSTHQCHILEANGESYPTRAGQKKIYLETLPKAGLKPGINSGMG